MVNFLMILGVLIRLLFVPLAGFKADMAFWKGWGLAVADKGIIWLVKNTNYNYPPAFAYVQWLINKIYALFKNPYLMDQYWSDTNLLYLFLFKLIPIISDVLIIFLIIKIAKKLKSNLGWFLGLIYFFNPVAIYDGAVWGQVDQFGLMLFLLSLYLLLDEKIRWATIVFVISFMMKFQNIIFIPLFYLYIYKKYSWQKLIENLGLSFLTILIITFPFWFNRETESLLKLLTINGDYFPLYSLNAFNFWWLASGLRGMQVVDKQLVLGVLNAKQVGLLMFIFAYFVGFVSLFFSDKQSVFKKLILSSTLTVFSFFHLLTQSHDRYLFPLIGLLLIWGLFINEKKRKSFFIFYLLFSILFFLNFNL